MASRDVTVRLPTLDRIIPPSGREALLRQLALLQIGRIKRRTRAGLDVNGNPFVAYSTSYAEQRRRAGRETKPSLWLEGGMLNSMAVVSADASKAIIGFQGSAPKTSFTHRTRMAKRKLMSQTQYVKVRTTVKTKGGGSSDLTVKLGPRTVPNALKARWNDKGDGPNPARHFFGFSAEDKAFLAKHALRELVKMAGRVTLNRAVGR